MFIDILLDELRFSFNVKIVLNQIEKKKRFFYLFNNYSVTVLR